MTMTSWIKKYIENACYCFFSFLFPAVTSDWVLRKDVTARIDDDGGVVEAIVDGVLNAHGVVKLDRLVPGRCEGYGVEVGGVVLNQPVVTWLVLVASEEVSRM